MLGGVSGISAYTGYSWYSAAVQQASRNGRFAGGAQSAQVSDAAQAQTAQGSGRTGVVRAAGRGANPEVPVEPVRPTSTVNADAANPVSYTIPFLREGMDPAEFAVRMRIRYADGEQEAADGQKPAEAAGIEGVQKTVEESKCETCEKRKYQDGSNDAGVSFKTPTRIAPEQVAAAVRGHEMEHVVREQAKAEREDRAVVSQSVTIHTDICPECGSVYVSGGTTRTTTAGAENPAGEAAGQESLQPRTPFSAVA